MRVHRCGRQRAQAPDPESRRFLNSIPTSFNLSDEQVDRLIAAGRDFLRGNKIYQDFLAGLKSGE